MEGGEGGGIERERGSEGGREREKGGTEMKEMMGERMEVMVGKIGRSVERGGGNRYFHFT